MTCDRGFNALDLRRFGIDRIVESKRPVESATRYLSTFGHLAQRGRVDGRREEREVLGQHVSGFEVGDIARAEAIFLEKVAALHPEADGKPCA
jgi:hypothetical protein